MNIGEKILSVRFIRLWNSLSREVVESQSLGTFKIRLIKALENML